MFFKKQAIEKHLTCTACHKLFDDPRVLPCSHTFCHSCLISSKEDNLLVCIKCEARHDVPSTGFPTSSVIVALLEEKAKEVSHTNKIKQLRQKLDSIDERCNLLSKSLRTGNDEIKEYCGSLRENIVSARETRIEEIQKYSEEFLEQVDEYENECLTTFNEISKSEEFPSLFEQTKRFNLSTVEILSQFEVKQQSVDTNIHDSINYLNLIETKERLLERKKLNDKQMFFDPQLSKLDPSSVGVIKRKNLVPSSISVKSLNFKASSDKRSVQLVYSSSNQLFYLAYQVNNTVELEFYGLNGSLVGNKTIIRINNGNTGCIFLTFLNLKGDCVLVLRKFSLPKQSSNYSYYTERSDGTFNLNINNSSYSLPSTTGIFFIKINKDQKYVSHLGVSHDSEKSAFQAINSSKIFCYDQARRKVWVYSTDLTATEHHFTENIPAETTKVIEANDDYLFILYEALDQMKVVIIEIQSKKAQRQISLPSLYFNQIKLLPDYLLAFDSRESQFWALCLKKWTQLIDVLKGNELILEKYCSLDMARDDSLYLTLFNNSGIRHFISVEKL